MNVVSQKFSEINGKEFNWKNRKVEVSHSQQGLVENSSKAILGATSTIGRNSYKSNWLAANCRYDVLLGMPWRVAHKPSINYEKEIVQVGKDAMVTDFSDESKVKVQKLSLKGSGTWSKKSGPT